MKMKNSRSIKIQIACPDGKSRSSNILLCCYYSAIKWWQWWLCYTAAEETMRSIASAMTHFANLTCIRFMAKTDNDVDYVFFIYQPGQVIMMLTTLFLWAKKCALFSASPYRFLYRPLPAGCMKTSAWTFLEQMAGPTWLQSVPIKNGGKRFIMVIVLERRYGPANFVELMWRWGI